MAMAVINLHEKQQRRRRKQKTTRATGRSFLSLAVVGLATFTILTLFCGSPNNNDRARYLSIEEKKPQRYRPNHHHQQQSQEDFHSLQTLDDAYRIVVGNDIMPSKRRPLSSSTPSHISLGITAAATTSSSRDERGSSRSINETVMEDAYHRRRQRPEFILHVGPPKTATTFLQCTICRDYYQKNNDGGGSNERFFLQDNLVYIGTCPCRAQSTDFVLHGHNAIFNHAVTWDEDHELGPAPFFSSIASDDAGNSNNNQTDYYSSPPILRESFRTRVQQVHDQGHNALMIFEGLHKFDQAHVAALADFLNPLFDVRIVLAYRRLFEWLPSKYNSITKPIGQADDVWPGTPIRLRRQRQTRNSTRTQKLLPFGMDHHHDNDTTTTLFGQLVRDIETWQRHPAHIVRDNYAQYFGGTNAVTIVPLHDLPDPTTTIVVNKSHNETTVTTTAAINPYLHYLFCSGVLATRHVCQAIQEGQIQGSKESNPSVSLDYFRLAEAAQERGWILQSQHNMSRWKVANLIQAKMALAADNKQNESWLPSHPQQCLSNATLQRLLNLSLTTEANLFGVEQAAEWQQGHRQAFEEYQSKNKYCWLDTDALLLQQRHDAENDNTDWIYFLKEIGRQQQQQQQQQEGNHQGK